MKLKIWKVKAEVRKPAKYRRKTTREFTPLKSGNPNLVENPRIVLASLHFFCRSRKHLPAAVSKQVCLHTSRPSGLGLALRWTSHQLPDHTQRKLFATVRDNGRILDDFRCVSKSETLLFVYHTTYFLHANCALCLSVPSNLIITGIELPLTWKYSTMKNFSLTLAIF
jgi:hypothetical protein